MVRIKRVYDTAHTTDGLRIPVDRLWPRGLTKAAAQIDLWLKDIAPSAELRKWFGHDPKRWGEFQEKYRAELASKGDIVRTIVDEARRRDITLLYAARDDTRNNASVLKDCIEDVRES